MQDYSRLDALSYFDKNAFWILFAVPDPRSFPDTVSEMLHTWLKGVEERVAFWVNRVYDFVSGVPVILVLSRIDLLLLYSDEDATMIRAKVRCSQPINLKMLKCQSLPR